tara:strand:+ start:551 stop:1177 length:627 start_codon:yes stop_codon:yes gene_type:complete
MTDFKEKYLKYKKKYLDLKSQIGGNFVGLFIIESKMRVPAEDKNFYKAQKVFKEMVGKEFEKIKLFIQYSTLQNKLTFQIHRDEKFSEEYEITALGENAFKMNPFDSPGRFKGMAYPIKIKTKNMEFPIEFVLDSDFKVKANKNNMRRKQERNFTDDDVLIGEKILEEIKKHVNKHNSRLNTEKLTGRIGDISYKRLLVPNNYLEMIN